MVEAKWTGEWPHLCHGEWILKVNGKDVSNLIPEELRDSEMNTFGTYRTWNFFNGWEVEWFVDTNGLCEKEWIKENRYWLEKITDSEEVMSEIFDAINACDFRYNSCGGCI